METIKEITMPKFLLAENPKGEGFQFIYSPHYLSLILVIPEDEVTALLDSKTLQKPRKSFHYGCEVFEFVLVQNNVERTGGAMAPAISEEEFLNEAWQWWENYLIWEDKNLIRRN